MSLPNGTPPEEAVKNMELIHVKPEYKTNTKTIHWSHVTEADAKLGKFSVQDLIESAMKDPLTLAIWKNENAHVLAWIEA